MYYSNEIEVNGVQERLDSFSPSWTAGKVIAIVVGMMNHHQRLD